VRNGIFPAISINKGYHQWLQPSNVSWQGASLIAQLVKNHCNAGDPGSIPGSGRSTGEGIGYPLQYSWASLVAQLVKNPPAMRETWVWSLGWEDPLEKGKATHTSILAWRIPWTLQSMGSQRVRQDWMTFTFTFFQYELVSPEGTQEGKNTCHQTAATPHVEPWGGYENTE